jgi:c-di-GMP-binding flagellar brake protein YcgR
MPVDLIPARRTAGGARARELALLRRNDVRVGVPVPFPIFDAHGRLLLREGEIVDSERALSALHEQGLYSDSAQARAASVRGDDGPWQPAPRVEPEGPIVVEKSFAQLKLLPGTVLHLDFLGESAGRPRVALRLIGHLEGASVILSTVNAQGGVVPFREGELVQVKVVAGNDIGAFTALVQKGCFTPFPYIHLGYPDAVQMKMLRRHARVETRLIVSVSHEDREGVAPVAALGVNLSASGMRLEVARELLARGDRVRIGMRLSAAGEDRTLTVSGSIRSVATASAPEGRAHCGVEFDELTPVDRLVLEHHVFWGLLEG